MLGRKIKQVRGVQEDFSKEVRISGGGEGAQEGEGAGAKVEMGACLNFIPLAWHRDPASPKVTVSSSLSPPVRLMAPDLLQITHVGTHKCNITWKVPQSSHYIESYLEFEARTRSPGHSWEVSAWPGPHLPRLLPPVLVTLSRLHVSKATVVPRRPLLLPCPACSGLPTPYVPPDSPGVQLVADARARVYIAKRQVTIL